MRIRKRAASLAVVFALVIAMLPVTASAVINGNTVSSNGGVKYLSGVVTITQADVEAYNSARDFFAAQVGLQPKFQNISDVVQAVEASSRLVKCSYCSKSTYWDSRPAHDSVIRKYAFVANNGVKAQMLGSLTDGDKSEHVDFDFTTSVFDVVNSAGSESVQITSLKAWGPYSYSCPCGKQYSYYNYSPTITTAYMLKASTSRVTIPDPVTEIVFDGVQFTGSTDVDTTEDSNYNWALWLVNQNLGDPNIKLTFNNCHGKISVGNNDLSRISITGGTISLEGAGNPYAYLHPRADKVDIALDTSSYVEFPSNYSDTSITATSGRYYKYNVANQRTVNNNFRGSGTWGLWVRYYNEFDGSQEPANGQLWIDNAVTNNINAGTATGTRSAQYRTSGSITLGNGANYQMQSLFQAAGPITVGALQLSQASVVSSTSIAANGTRGTGSISTGFTAPKLDMQSLNYSSAAGGTITFTTTSATGESVIRKSTLPGLGIVAAANDIVLFESNTVNAAGTIMANLGSVVNINNSVAKGKLSTSGSGEVVIDGSTTRRSPEQMVGVVT